MQSQKQVGKPCDHSKRKAAFNPILCMMVPHGKYWFYSSVCEGAQYTIHTQGPKLPSKQCIQ